MGSNHASPADLGSVVDRRRAVGKWLLALAAMVLVMVVLGGLTRLTGSGLSMVQWHPLSLLPPMSTSAWRQVFADYQASPQYRLLNEGMTLGDFKAIFWLEYIHRLWGRLIGFAFLAPFLWFVGRGAIGRAEAPRLALLFVLGGLQGVLGWLMVASGLAERPEVSHYRLMAHLMAALLIYGALLWTAFHYLTDEAEEGGDGRGLSSRLIVLLGLICLTMAAGALTAGLHAGLVFNSFPLMDGHLLPAEAFDRRPIWLNFFENLALVQFDHRVLAVLSWVTSWAVWLSSLTFRLTGAARRLLAAIPVLATLQAGVGIATLLMVVPVALAAIHQTIAVLLFTAVLAALHEVRA